MTPKNWTSFMYVPLPVVNSGHVARPMSSIMHGTSFLKQLGFGKKIASNQYLVEAKSIASEMIVSFHESLNDKCFDTEKNIY